MNTVSKALLAVAVLGVAAPALAQDEWAQQVEKQMDSVADKLSESGYHYGGYSHDGSLKQGGTERLTVRLGTGTTQFVGLCDNDCTDVDLGLYDANGKQIDEDVQDDDYPVVSVRPTGNAVYTLVVLMSKCSAEPCRYAVQQFVK
jgi:hypothetical protein